MSTHKLRLPGLCIEPCSSFGYFQNINIKDFKNWSYNHLVYKYYYRVHQLRSLR